MAFSNASPSSSLSVEFDDTPIVFLEPVALKKPKEEVPDKSVISVIGDDAYPPQNLQSNSVSPLVRFNTPLENIYHASYEEQIRINSCFPKTLNHFTNKTNGILEHNASSFKLSANCESCALSHGVISNNKYDEPPVLINRTPITSTLGNDQADKETRCNFEDREAISNKTCNSNCNNYQIPTASSNHDYGNYKHIQLSSTLSLNKPEISQQVNIQDQHSKFRKSLSECERLEHKLLCPVCFKKNCKCNFIGKKFNANPSINCCNSIQIAETPSESSSPNSDEIASIWEYLRLQEEKINSIDKKVSNFISQHASCCIDHQTKRNDLSIVSERDIPYILSILGEQSGKIIELQDQIKLLNSRYHSSSTNNKIVESISNQPKTVSCVCIENCNKDINCPFSHNVACSDQRQKVTKTSASTMTTSIENDDKKSPKQKVSKTSTSTMTSFIFENDDKLVYHKQLTVFTDIMKEQKATSCLPKNLDTPLTKSNLNGKNSNSHKKRSPKLKCSPILKCKTSASSNSSSGLLASNDKKVLKTSHKSEKKSKRGSTGNKVIDEIYINNWSSDNDEEDEKNFIALKTDTRKSHSSKQKSRNSTSPKAELRKPRDTRNKKKTLRSSSSSSTDSERVSSKQRQETFDKPELDSEDEPQYLSVATVNYLNKYGLNHSHKKDRTGSSRKKTSFK